MTELLKISLPDGSVREVPAGSTPADIAAAIGPGLAKAALAARVDGELRDLTRPFDSDASLALVTARDEADALELCPARISPMFSADGGAGRVPGTQDHLSARRRDGSYPTLKPKAASPFSWTMCPRSRAKMRMIILVHSRVRDCWSRRARIAGESRRQDVRPMGIEMPERGYGPYGPVTRPGGFQWLEMFARPSLPFTWRLDPTPFRLMRAREQLDGAATSGRPLSRIYGTGCVQTRSS